MLIARLQAVAGLTQQDRCALQSLPYSFKSLESGDCVIREGERPNACTVLMDGFLARRRVIGDRNQISAFYVAGDMPDLHTLHLPTADHDICSIGRSRVAVIGHSHLMGTLTASATLSHAFWRETLIQSAIYRDWVENLAARQALPRLAHLVCELAARLEVVGLLREGSFTLPFTQEIIADACGLSIVHINRTIQELRRQGLIEWEGHRVELLNRSRLQALAEFDASYLHALRR